MNLKQLREVSGLSQWTTARRSRLPRMKLSLAESGQLELRPEEEAAIRKVLHEAIRERQSQLKETLDSSERAAMST